MSDKLTTEQLKAIKDATCSNDIVSMVDEILEFRSGKQWLDMVIKPTEPSPLAALIAQCEQDKIDYPDFWWELWQWANPNEVKWFAITDDHSFSPDYQYRPHPHRASIIEFHRCSDADKARWEFRLINTTHFYSSCGLVPKWEDGFEYRIRPKVCQITINGTVFEYPEPVREIELGAEYFLCDVYHDTVTKYKFDAQSIEEIWLKNGLIHLTEQAAQHHMTVMKAKTSALHLEGFFISC